MYVGRDMSELSMVSKKIGRTVNSLIFIMPFSKLCLT